MLDQKVSKRTPKCFSTEPDQKWLASEAWRQHCTFDAGWAGFINGAISDLVLTGSTVGNPYNNCFEVNVRAALPSILNELGRDEVIALYRIAESLYHFPLDEAHWQRRAEYEARFLEVCQ